MPNKDDKGKSTIKEQREKIDNELTEYDVRATERYGNTFEELKEGRMDKETADADAKLIEEKRQGILNRRAELGPDVKVGDKNAQYATKNFKPKSLGAAVPSELEQSQSREELLRNFNQSAEKSQEIQDIGEQDKPQENPQISKDQKDTEKGDDDKSK